MKAWRKLFGGAFALLLGAAASASAAPITFTDTFNPTDVYFSGSGAACSGANGTTDTVSGANSHGCSSLSYVQTLPGFNSATDTLTSGSLLLTFYDDAQNWLADLFDGSESAKILTDGNPHTYAITSGGSTSSTAINVLANILADGTLNVNVSEASGDFYFAASTLTAGGNRADAPILPLPVNNPAPVPEPASLLFVGTGLVALVRRFRVA
jgi:hypothetical protein